MKTCTCRFYVKCHLAEVGVGPFLKMETQDFCVVVKLCEWARLCSGFQNVKCPNSSLSQISIMRYGTALNP